MVVMVQKTLLLKAGCAQELRKQGGLVYTCWRPEGCWRRLFCHRMKNVQGRAIQIRHLAHILQSQIEFCRLLKFKMDKLYLPSTMSTHNVARPSLQNLGSVYTGKPGTKKHTTGKSLLSPVSHGGLLNVDSYCLAYKKAQLITQGMRQVNLPLSTMFSHHTFEAIKGQRRRQANKDLVARITQELSKGEQFRCSHPNDPVQGQENSHSSEMIVPGCQDMPVELAERHRVQHNDHSQASVAEDFLGTAQLISCTREKKVE